MNTSTDEIVRLYTEDGLTTRQIAPLVGMSARTVTRRLNEAGVTMRPPGSEPNEGLQDEPILRRLYLSERKTCKQIGEILCCSPSRVSDYLTRYGIPIRPPSLKGRKMTKAACEKMSKAKQGRYIGSDNPNWRGGTLFRDPERNRYPSKMWVKAVKDRDGWKCVECSSTDRLHAHHIKRWKDYPELRYEVSNGVTLCHPCHEKAHGRGFKFRWRHERRKTHECTAPAEAG